VHCQWNQCYSRIMSKSVLEAGFCAWHDAGNVANVWIFGSGQVEVI